MDTFEESVQDFKGYGFGIKEISMKKFLKSVCNWIKGGYGFGIKRWIWLKKMNLVKHLKNGMKIGLKNLFQDKEEIEELKADYDLQSVYEYSCKRKISVEKEIEKALEVLMDNGNLFFKDYEGKVSPISYCNVDNGKIFFME